MISVVVNTYNEEKNIARCLESLTWVDEVVLIDMGSADKTLSIAERYNARIYKHAYTGFVEPARNFAIEKAKGEWILIVDADEEVPATLAQYLRVASQNSGIQFYRIPRKNIIFGRFIRHSGWWPDYQVRFFRKGTVKWTERIHGVPFTQGQGQDIDLDEKYSITHFNYQTVEQYIDRMNRYTSVLAKELFISGDPFRYGDLFDKPSREFIHRFFVFKGYQDGIHGLALSFLQSFSELITYIKLWQLYDFKETSVKLPDVEEHLRRTVSTIYYWLIQEILSQSQSPISRFIWRLRRKLKHYG